MAAIFKRLARNARNLAAIADYEVALEVVALRARVPLSDLRRRRVWRQGLGRLKRLAIYLAVMNGHSRRDVARAAGVSAELVARYCHHIEEARDDVGFDRVLDEMELEMMA
jgi:hypothetical protein